MTGSSTPLHTLSAQALVEGFAASAFTPEDALEAIFARIDARNAAVNAIIAQDRDVTRQQAHQATQRWRHGKPLSALDGVPMTVKDNLCVAGFITSWGSELFRDALCPQDELPIARLRAAGAVFLGKTNVPEFTLQGYTDNIPFGPTYNPFAPGLTPGGSSGGAVTAVALGMGPVAIATDGGGSLRRPTAHCGLFGFKPSLGMVARGDGLPEILHDFEVVGPIARTPHDLRLVYDVLSGPDPRDSLSRAAGVPARVLPASPRIGYFSRVGDAPVDPTIIEHADRFAQDLEEHGCQVDSIAAPFDPDTLHAAWGKIASAGLAWLLDKHPDASGDIGGNAKALWAQGAKLGATDYVAALEHCKTVRAQAAALFQEYDFLLCPAIAALAWPADRAYPETIAGRPAGPRGHALFTAWMNVAGLTAASIPVALTERDGGIGMQLVGAIGDDRALIDFLARSPAIPQTTPRHPAMEEQA